jgi:putative ABC transport system permease protein
VNLLRFALVYVPRSLLRGGRRAVVTIACIAVGVTAVVALEVASLSIGDALTTNVRAANGGDISLASNSAPLSSADLTTFQQLQAKGLITQWTAVSRVHVTANAAGGLLIPFDAEVIDTPTYPIGGQPTFVEPAGGTVGNLLSAPGDVLISSVLAEELGTSVGGHVTVNGIGGPGLKAVVRGVLAQATLEHAAAMFVRGADQGALTTAPPQYVNVYANTSGDSAPAAAALRQAFPQASTTTVAEAVQSAQQQVHDFHTYALLAGLVALLVAGVGIQNAMQSMLASRVNEVAMLKALGNSPMGVGTVFTAEAAVLGAVGGVIGAGAGIGASSAVTAALSRATAIQAPVHIDALVALEGVLLGIGATVLFSLLPVVGAVSVRPLGLLRGEPLPVRRSAPRYAGLFFAVVALFAVLASYVTGDPVVSVLLVAGGVIVCGALAAVFAAVVATLARLRSPDRRATALLVAVLLGAVVAGTALTEPALTPLALFALAVWTAIALGPQRWRLWLLMAGRSLDRRRARTAVTLVALFTGALAGGLTMTMASGLRDQIAQAIADNGTTNLVAVAAQPSRDALLRNAARLPAVQASQATLIASGRVTAIDGHALSAAVAPSPSADPEEDDRLRPLNGVTGYDLASGQQPPSIIVNRGRPLDARDAGTSNVLVDQSLSDPPLSIHPGSTVTLADATTGNRVTLTVVGMYQRQGLRSVLTSRYSPRVYGDVTAAQQLAEGNIQTVLSMTVAPDRLDSDSVALQRAVPSALVANVNDLTVVVRTTLNNLLLVLTVVTAMVVVAGMAVVANGVTLALIERAREVALFKAVGFGPGNVLTLVLMEYGLAGFLAAAVGVVSIAVTLAILSSATLQTPIAFSVGISTLLLVTSVAVTVLTSWVAARKGAWVRPLTALRNS